MCRELTAAALLLAAACSSELPERTMPSAPAAGASAPGSGGALMIDGLTITPGTVRAGALPQRGLCELSRGTSTLQDAKAIYGEPSSEQTSGTTHVLSYEHEDGSWLVLVFERGLFERVGVLAGASVACAAPDGGWFHAPDGGWYKPAKRRDAGM